MAQMAQKGPFPGHGNVFPHLLSMTCPSIASPWRPPREKAAILGRCTDVHLWKLYYCSSPAPPAGGRRDRSLQSRRNCDCSQIQFCACLLNLKSGTFITALQTLSWRVGEYAAAPKDILFLQEEKGLTYISHCVQVICNQILKCPRTLLFY